MQLNRILTITVAHNTHKCLVIVVSSYRSRKIKVGNALSQKYDKKLIKTIQINILTEFQHSNPVNFRYFISKLENSISGLPEKMIV